MNQEGAQARVEAHQISCPSRHDVRILPTDVLGRGAHRRIHRFARRIHEQLGKQFEHGLDLLWVGLLQVCHLEGARDVGYAARDLFVGLIGVQMLATRPLRGAEKEQMIRGEMD